MKMEEHGCGYNIVPYYRVDMKWRYRYLGGGVWNQNHTKDFGKASAYNVGDPVLIPGSGRSPGEGNGNPLHYSCLENPMDGEAWYATVHKVAESRTGLSDFTFTFSSLEMFSLVWCFFEWKFIFFWPLLPRNKIRYTENWKLLLFFVVLMVSMGVKN